MKRLLAYLFIVLGLGLVFSISANASTKKLYELKVNFCKSSKIMVGNTIGRVVPTLVNCDKFKGFGMEIGTHVDSDLNEFNKHNSEARKKYYGEKYNTVFCLRKDNSKRSNSLATKFLASSHSCEKLGNDYAKVIFKDGKFFTTEKTQFAKAEPSQTQRAGLDIILCDNDSKRDGIGTYIRNNVNGKCPNKGIEVSRRSIASKYNSLGISIWDNWKLCYIKDNPKLLQVIFAYDLPCGTFGNSAKVLEYDPKNGNYFYNLSNTQTQIAEAEPNVKPKKKIKVAKVEEPKQKAVPLQKMDKINLNLVFCLYSGDGVYAQFDPTSTDLGTAINPIEAKFANNCKNISTSVFLKKLSDQKKIICYAPNNPVVNRIIYERDSCEGYPIKMYRILFDGSNFYYSDEKQTQIAKAEPSQTRKAAMKDQKHLCVNEFNEKLMIVDKILKDQDNQCKYKFYKQDNLYIYKRLFASAIPSALVPSGDCRIDTCGKAGGISKYGFNKIIDEVNKMTGSTFAQVKIEKHTKQKKKVKVAKVEEPEQEEFKPKKTNQDNEAPIIEIAETITVDSQTYTLKGKVKDKSKLYLEANGRPLKISKRGNFELEGFVVDPDAGDQIKIVAIDQWKNKSEKTINIKVEFKEIAELRSYEKPNPSKIKVKQDKNKIAIIIGIEKYKILKNIDAPYANRDANAFRAYANRALGIPNKNIKVLIDENATRGETLKALTLWLPQIAREKNKDIYVFFAGHGLASDDGKNLYILPQDGDAALLQYTALSRLEIFDLINRVEPKSVTMFFDTCYSGQTRDERMLVAGLRPIRLVAEEQEVQNNFTIFTASNYDQTSGSIEEAKHGIFSYYLMMGMQGKADTNQDKKITNGELIAYLKQNVSEEAFINNRQQEPMLSGDPDKVLISYR